MPLKNYHVLVGRAVDLKLDDDSSPHVEVRIEAAAAAHRIAVNVQSSAGHAALLYHRVERFEHPVLAGLAELPEGFTDLTGAAAALALDYVRGAAGRALVARDQMRIVPFRADGPSNDLKEFLLDDLLRSAVLDPAALVYAFGERWPARGEESQPINRGPDEYFGFVPKSGIHDIHMDQGNPEARYRHSNGVRQDGALLVRFAGRWVAVLLAFQTQSWTTDGDGHPVGAGPDPRPIIDRNPNVDALVQIVAAMINAPGTEAGRETVTLLNRSDADVSLDGWAIVDDEGRASALEGGIGAGEARRIRLPGTAGTTLLGNKGGEILLRAGDGTPVHRVAYAKADVGPDGWSVLF
jgi:uncharacterized protein YukJ